jgi:hypothetical protein
LTHGHVIKFFIFFKIKIQKKYLKKKKLGVATATPLGTKGWLGHPMVNNPTVVIADLEVGASLDTSKYTSESEERPKTEHL